MKRPSCIYLIVLFLLFFNGNQEGNTEEILWSKERKLTWEDFKGKVDYSSKFGAAIASGIKYIYTTKKDSIYLTISAVFYKNKSWVNNLVDTNKGLLHEQCHFDISEIYTRKYRKEIINLNLHKGKIEFELDRLYNQLSLDLDKYQNLYDLETHHSVDEKEQERWEQLIAIQLQELEAYENPIVKIKLLE